ncbi:hypothetical protein [Serinibacter salmoneus]|uniref:hypothetical protein n=1 Tax=Serinibacter salmoneus TaxID=556530 RepID=UPI00117B3929|nr:hypothetical protein [Serinibacter salmoneus]
MATGLALATACTPPDDATHRAVSLGFEDVAGQDRPDLTQIADELAAVEATAVHLAAGRVEWTTFPWPDHPEAWSAAVSEAIEEGGSGDLLGEAITHLAGGGLETQDASPGGPEREVVLTIDALVPSLIAQDATLAGVTANGEASDLFASAAALAEGEVGDRLVAMAEHLARTYRPEAITVTELMFDDATFSEQDLALYRRMTGESDWPRDDGGAIDEEAAEIGAWRSQVLADLLTRMRERVAPHGVALAVDVRADWEDPVRGRAQSGHDLTILGDAVDRFILWNYPGLVGRTGAESADLTAGLAAGGVDPDRVTVSVGLWAAQGEGAGVDADLASSQSGDGVLPVAQFADAVAASATSGVTAVAVTPRSLMTPGHWEALRGLWAP